MGDFILIGIIALAGVYLLWRGARRKGKGECCQ